MELYLEDTDMMINRPLHWPLPNGIIAPSESERPHGAHGRAGRLITIGPCTREPGDPPETCEPANELIERACDTPQQVASVISEFSNLTLIYFNCHSVDSSGESDLSSRGTVTGIKLGGANIYNNNLGHFSGIRPSLASHSEIDQAVRGLITACGYGQYSEQLADFTTIQERGFNQLHPYFVPRIVMRSCSIGTNQTFCQGLANAAGAFVFAPVVDQCNRAPVGPWQLHGPVNFFIPSSLAEHRYQELFQYRYQDWQASASTLRRDLSPFRQRMGPQMIGTGSGRGAGRRQGVIG